MIAKAERVPTYVAADRLAEQPDAGAPRELDMKLRRHAGRQCNADMMRGPSGDTSRHRYDHPDGISHLADAKYVKERLAEIVKDEDLSKFVL